MKYARWILIGLLPVVLLGAGCGEVKEEENPLADFKSSFTGGVVKVKMITSKGDIHLVLDGVKAPVTVDNFLKYAESGFYRNTVFHRLIRNQLLQGGGFTTNLAQKANAFPAIKNESKNGLKNVKGTMAMARGAHPDSATCEFYINLNDNVTFDHPNVKGDGHTVFGKVADEFSMLTLQSIMRGATAPAKGLQDVPEKLTVIVDVVRTDLQK